MDLQKLEMILDKKALEGNITGEEQKFLDDCHKQVFQEMIDNGKFSVGNQLKDDPFSYLFVAMVSVLAKDYPEVLLRAYLYYYQSLNNENKEKENGRD